MKKSFILLFVLLMTGTIFAQSGASFSVALNDDSTGVVITAYNGSGAEVAIPLSLEGLPVKGIGKDAFRNKTTITKLVIPRGVTEIGSGAFQGCRNMATVTLPDTLKKIGSRAFDSCGLSTVSIPAGCTDIGEGAFANCTSLKTMVLPRDLASIPPNMFLGCEALNPVTMPAAIKSIGSKAFADCKALATFNVPASVELIEFADDVFSGCGKLNLGAQVALKKLGYNGSF